MARRNYKIWDHISSGGWCACACFSCLKHHSALEFGHGEIELNLSDRIDIKNTDCIIFSKYLIGNTIFDHDSYNYNSDNLKCCCCDENKSVKSLVALITGIYNHHLRHCEVWPVSALLCSDNEIYSMMEEWYREYNDSIDYKPSFVEYLMQRICAYGGTILR